MPGNQKGAVKVSSKLRATSPSAPEVIGFTWWTKETAGSSDFPPGAYFLYRTKRKENLLVAQALGNMGALNNMLGNHEKAFNIFKRLLKINEDIGDYKILSQTHGNLGITFHKLSNSFEIPSFSTGLFLRVTSAFLNSTSTLSSSNVTDEVVSGPNIRLSNITCTSIASTPCETACRLG